MAWVRHDGQNSLAASSVRPIAAYGHSANGAGLIGEMQLWIHRDTSLAYFTHRNGPGGSFVSIESGTAVPPGQATMLAVTRSGTTNTLYVNGLSQGMSSTANHRVNTDFTLGGTPWDDVGNARYFHGVIDEFLLLDHALNAASLLDLYDKGTSP